MTQHDDPIRAESGTTRLMTVFSRDVGAVGRAREGLTAFLAERVSATQMDDANLVLGELVTNALRHGLGEVVVRASLDGGAVSLSVTDSGQEQPTMLPRDPHRIGGLGLHIVDGLSSRWGVAAFPGGKTVWATIALTR
jgi:anti-sigma regulatory factor (Ser/Thr protein kinase)